MAGQAAAGAREGAAEAVAARPAGGSALLQNSAAKADRSGGLKKGFLG